MPSSTFPKAFFGGLLTSGVLLLSACGGSSGTTSPTADSSGQNFDQDAADARVSPVNGPLDTVQDAVVTEVLSGQLASSLPAPLDSHVTCLAVP